MFKKLLLAALCAVAAVSFTACSSVETGSDLNGLRLSANENFEGAGHVFVDIWGIYFLGFPVFTGAVHDSGKCRVFTDTVTTGNAVSMLTGNAKAKYKSQVVTDIRSEKTTVWLWPTVFFVYKDVQASGNVLK